MGDLAGVAHMDKWSTILHNVYCIYREQQQQNMHIRGKNRFISFGTDIGLNRGGMLFVYSVYYYVMQPVQFFTLSSKTFCTIEVTYFFIVVQNKKVKQNETYA